MLYKTPPRLCFSLLLLILLGSSGISAEENGSTGLSDQNYRGGHLLQEDTKILNQDIRRPVRDLQDNVSRPLNTFNVTQVECPSTVTVFTAITELFFIGGEGRDPANMDGTGILYENEWDALSFEFTKIYNTLTTTKCDAKFRKITALNRRSVQVENETIAAATPSERFLQANQPNATSTGQSGVNQTSRESSRSMSVEYEVVGRCRNCFVSSSGSFDLYDDANRRLSRLHIINVRELQEDESIAFAEDCFCEEGTEPVLANPPGVQECVDAMNVRFDDLEVTEGLFENITMTNLVQVDDHEEVVGLVDASNSSTPTTETDGMEEEKPETDGMEEEEPDTIGLETSAPVESVPETDDLPELVFSRPACGSTCSGCKSIGSAASRSIMYTIFVSAMVRITVF